MVMLKSVIAKIQSNDFLKHNLIFFVGSMLVAFLNYLYYPVMGRLLSNVEFGELQVIASAFMQMTTILSVLSLVTINILINQPSKKLGRQTVAELEKVSLYVGFVVLLVVALCSELLKDALQFTSAYPFIAIVVAIVISIPLTFRTAYLKSQKDFSGTSLSGAVTSVAKLLFSIILVYAALKTFGAVIGIVLSQTTALLYTNYRAKKVGYVRPRSSTRTPNFKLLKPQMPYAVFVLCMSLLTTLQISIDVTIVKYLFSPEQAGNYAAIATVARIIFFLAGSIIAVMISSTSLLKSSQENFRILTKSAILVVSLCGTATMIFCLFPTLIMHLLLGTRYDSYAHLLPLLSLTIFIGSLVSLLSAYFISLRIYYAGLVVVGGSLLTLVLVVVRHATLEHVIIGILSGSVVTFIVLSACALLSRRHALT